MSGKLRVLPLGGVGEIGKNMTVVEYDGRIVVIDCGLRFPTAEMMGIDLVLPDFTYLREHVDAIEAIVQDMVFRGATFAYELRVQGHATPLFSYRQTRAPAAPGEAVGLSIPEGAAVILEDRP